MRLITRTLISADTRAALTWLAGRRRIDFRGRAVLITGGSRGLGLLLACAFAAEGARLFWLKPLRPASSLA